MLDARRFAEMLRKCRTEKNLTQNELAQKLFVTPQSISKWERGEGMPDLENLCALAESLSVSVDALLGREADDRTFIGIRLGEPARFVQVDERGVVLNSLTLSETGVLTKGVRARMELLQRGIDRLRPAARNTEGIYIIGNFFDTAVEDVNLQQTLLQQRYPTIKIACGGLLSTIQASSGVPSQRAMLVIGGTMNVAIYQVCAGHHVRTGRGSYLARPNGSLYNIGHAALVAVCEEEDEIGEATILTPLLNSWLGVGAIKSALPRITQSKPGFIATFAHLVDIAAQKGDKVANRILRDCSDDLARLIRAAHKKTPQADHVVLASTLFTAKSDLYYELVRQRLEPEFTVVRLTSSLEWEACLRAAQLCGAGDNMSLELFAKSGQEMDYEQSAEHGI